ncbi:hypothetical protein ABZW10_36645 [Kitasatospora sp. NPDC004723]|uniref:hypothetical protein n=1 Tax=Kitasatospora sp. NPDC004723 TaxID=3154288 RepID=UPI0033A8FA9E
MTDQQTTCGSQHVVEAVTGLLACHEHLGAEALALLAAEKEITAEGRLATIRRMRTGLSDAAGLLAEGVQLLTAVHGSAVLGIDGAVSHAADGTPVTLLPAVRPQQELLLEAWELVQESVDRLEGKAFAATKRSPGLAAARVPDRTGPALLRLRDGVLAIGRELAGRGLDEDAAECRQSAELLERLEARVCPPPPPAAVVPRPTAEQVVAAIRADPTIAQAAAGALQSAGS